MSTIAIRPTLEFLGFEPISSRNGAKVRCLCIRQSALDILEETSGDSPNTCAEQPEQAPVASEDDGFPF